MGARTRMVLAWAAFAAWVGWLGFLSMRYGRFPVVSRAQLLNADIAVIADVTFSADGVPSVARLGDVIWPAGAKFPAGATPRITNLAKVADWRGPKNYVLVLKAAGDGKYEIASLPRSPALDHADRLFVYPATPEVLTQFRDAPGPAARPF